MKENAYDDEAFFEKYSQFPRSVEGLSAAGEWEEFERLLPDFAGKRVLDVGCGFGWHCIYAAEHGAARVVGTDISRNMLDVAREKTAFPQVSYERVAMEDLDFPADSFDIVLSSLAFHYTPDFGVVCKRIASCLAPGGSFVFSVEHPVFTAYGNQDWFYDAHGERAHWPVDGYFAEGPRDAVFLGERVTKYHKTLTTYLDTLLNSGFAIKRVVEPQPAPHLLDVVEGMRDELRRPMMLIVAAEKAR
ncbi:class I SAM-dependent methyltransferase [Eggerthella sinensis]|uniref:SAM-dependent methyltransferase n=1 Tax=Eggerthella sinensis TaxID=242230 RepID=A0A3N0IPU1_9ACTN|nr:class I SAM-dependent methyltransferase [Eggerthella sinensis]RDB70700.1 SAM-dependent methyltransferase [Eggerthella sinensis]RNM38984.1 SAM-dependent methyltransferase [Eggerthella sinensis]